MEESLLRKNTSADNSQLLKHVTEIKI